MERNLVIVESPAKAKTLSKILGESYNFKASLGHIRDLPKSQLGVDVEHEFTPKYVIPRTKSKLVTELKEAAKKATVVYLATDPDREGEAISWHLMEVTRSNHKPYRRVVFHEITEEAVKQAFKHPRAIDMQLVNAQQARRILDRLVGYRISPLLWKKVRRGLSAGRVQSVALKIIVDREREIEQFVPVEYWSIEAELGRMKPSTGEHSFRAALVGLADGTKIELHKEEEATEIANQLREAKYGVAKVKTKKVTRQPAPPFITSTLQQEAWRKLHFTAALTMSVAQQLYEGISIGDEGNAGLITYMRTDSTKVARVAVNETREYIGEKYGAEYVPPHARSFIASVKGAQEAHEAIRPTKIRREPAMVKPYLTAPQFKLYDLIWKRMLASQMSAAIFDSITVDVQAACRYSGTKYLLRASSSTIDFPGFMVVYIEGSDEANGKKEDAVLPKLGKGEELKLIDLFPEQHFTQPPPRYTEASLVKMLEQWGIGRPSTYAPIMSTIQGRDYVTRNRGTFQPTELGIIISDLLTKYFPDIVDIKFTARMEDELDEIASENHDWVRVVQDFYVPLEKDLENASQRMEKIKIADEVTEEVCPECGKPMVIKSGRYGKFLACSGFPECKYHKSLQVKVGVKCPECGGELLQRVSKKKRVFYGCAGYPKCRFATYAKPLPEKCPECGGMLTLYRTKWAKCTKCNYKKKLPED